MRPAKLCPFCWAQVEGPTTTDGVAFVVVCKCGARGPSAGTAELALAEWNMRPEETHLKITIEQSRSPCCSAAVRCGRCGGDTRYTVHT